MSENVLSPDPPNAILRIRTVMRRTGLTRPTLYRKVAEGTFPKQVQISTKCVGWRAAEIDEWLRNPMDYRAPNTPD